MPGIAVSKAESNYDPGKSDTKGDNVKATLGGSSHDVRVDAPSFSQNYTITLTGRPQDGKEWSVSSADKYRVIVKKTDASGKVRDESSNWGVYPSYVYYCSTNVPIIVSFTGESHFATTRKSDQLIGDAYITTSNFCAIIVSK